MPTTRTRPTRSQTRERVLAAAADVFTTHGFHATSLDQVAEAAGLTKGAVYSSFSGKDELFSALVADRLDQRLGLVEHEGGDLHTLFADAEDDLAALFTSQRDWHLLFIECWTRAMRDSDRREAWARQRQAARAVITDFFERHAAASDTPLPMPASDIAVVSMALSNGLAMEHIADPDAVDPRLFGRVMGALTTS